MNITKFITVDDVRCVLHIDRDIQKVSVYVLDIETDCTGLTDEQAEALALADFEDTYFDGY